MSNDQKPARPAGWRLVLEAFLAAPNRTLNNAQLGSIRGVQAFHQRISNLKDKGFVLTSAVRITDGYYAYRLVGYQPDTEAQQVLEAIATSARQQRGIGAVLAATDDKNSRALAVIHDVARAVADATADLRRNPPSPAQRSIPYKIIGQPGVAPDKVHIAESPSDGYLDKVRAVLAEVLDLTPAHVAGEDILMLANRVKAVTAERTAAAASARRPRATTPNRERRPSGPTGPDLMRKALEAHGKPMHTKAIAAFVMANGGDDLFKGKTPAATMAAQLATSNKDEGTFVKTEPGCYGLREWDAATLAMEAVR